MTYGLQNRWNSSHWVFLDPLSQHLKHDIARSVHPVKFSPLKFVHISCTLWIGVGPLE